MTHTNYIIFILLLILLLSVFFIFAYKKKSTKEGATPNPTPSLKNGVIDTTNYTNKITELTNRYNYLMARVPITFYAGNIEYNYNTDIPLVIFSGGVPYVYVNMRLPYPPPGDNGDPGDPGPTGIAGPQGAKGGMGLTGYSGLNYSGFLNSDLSK
jgi:hypothetical protein